MALAGLPVDLVAQIRCPTSPSGGKQPQRAGTRAQEEPLFDETTVAESLVHARVRACGSLARATRTAVKILQSAGDGLQRSMGAVHADASFRRCAHAGVTLPTAQPGSDLIEACSSLGSTLTGLAAVLAADMLEPLQEMQLRIRADCENQQALVVSLEQQEAYCSNEVRESIARKDKASWDLQNAMQENDKLQSALPGFLSRLTSPKLESQLQQVAGVQTAAVEDLATKMDQAAAARMQREKAMAKFQECLSIVDGACTNKLRRAMRRCVGAWEEAAGELREAARRMQDEDVAGASAAKAPVPSAAARPLVPAAGPVPPAAPAAAAGAAAGTSAGDANSAPTRLHSALEEVLRASGAQGAAAGALPAGGGGSSLAGIEDGGPPLEEVPAVAAAEAIAIAGIGEALEPMAGDGAEAQEPEVPQAANDSASGVPDAASAGAPGETTPQPQASPRPPPSSSTAAANAVEQPQAPVPRASPKPSPKASPTASPRVEPAAAAPLAAVAATAAAAIPAEGAAQPAAEPLQPQPQPVVVHFGEDVKRLGFEVLWDDERPSVGNVPAEGAARRNGLRTGDVLTEIAGTDTLGRSRDELMPFLKVRPLELKLIRSGDGEAQAAEHPEAKRAPEPA